MIDWKSLGEETVENLVAGVRSYPEMLLAVAGA